MAYSEAQRNAKARYVRHSVKQVVVRFYPKDEDFYEWLGTKEGGSRATYLRKLALAEYERETGKSV